ncbi:MAG: hypothetical protein DRJ10_12030 [Bacteroidetes bacterium]|nr:MAG: hypothetical protein DRJ10_12030 [Bacteroidota bacterium]
MERFDKSGMLIIPNPEDTKIARESKELLVVKECYCPNGHNLANPRASFNDIPGILLKIINSKNKSGFIALSPVFGQKQRLSLDIDLFDGEKIRAFCPHCNVELPIFADCTSCDSGNLLALYLDQTISFKNCLALCNTIGCKNARVITSHSILKDIKYLIAK